jgi:hypothetical protein
VFDIGNRDYGKESNPHITVLYGIQPEEEEKAKSILSKIPGKLTATLGPISLFENSKSDDGRTFDVLKIDVKSPHLSMVNKTLRNSVKYESSYPDYRPHVTLAYLQPGKGKEYVGNNKFAGMKFLFDVFVYSGGDKDVHSNVPMALKEYLVGQSGGYGAAAGGATAALGWASTPGTQTSGRPGKVNPNRKSSYMHGNTVVNNSLYDTIRPEDLAHPKFDPDEIMTGLRWEMKRLEYPDKTRARPFVIQNLEKNPKYYSELGMYNMDGK